jgi:PAS domain S-box-containing protein
LADSSTKNDRILEELERYKAMYLSSSDAIMTIEPPDWRFTSGNPATLKLFDIETEKVLQSLNPGDLSPEFQPDGQRSQDKSKEMIEKALKDGSVLFEWTHKRYKGGDFPATVLLTKIKMGDKEVVQATVRDITKERETKHKLSLLAGIVESSDDAILSKDFDGKILSWNKGAEKMYGYKADEIIGKNISLLLPEDRPTEVKDILKRIEKGEKIENLETQRKNKDGKVIDISLTVSPIKDENGKINGASSIARNIIKQKQTEKAIKERILETEKFNKLMVGRELKMIELKEEIKRLKEQLHGNQIKEYQPKEKESWSDKFKDAIELEESVIIKLRDHYQHTILESRLSNEDKEKMLEKLKTLVDESLGHKDKLEKLNEYERSK